MPLYEYLCPDCATRFELRRAISQIDAPARCPKCQGIDSRRQISLPMFFTRTEDGGLTAVGSSLCDSCALTSCAGCAIGR